MGVGKPVWSPDGKRIALEHFGDGDTQPSQVFVLNVDGTNLHRVSVNSGVVYAESDPAWSPDGSELAYWSYGYGLAVTSAGGGVPIAVYRDFPRVSYGAKPAWSHDGMTLAFNRWRSSSNDARSVVVIELYAGGHLELVHDGYDLAYSPDQKRIAYTMSRSDST